MKPHAAAVATLAAIWGLTAFILVALGIRRVVASVRLHRDGDEAAAVIVSNHMTSGHLGRVWYRAIVEFRTEEGRKIRGFAPNRRRSGFRSGTAVRVRYSARRPEEFEILDGPGQGHAGTGLLFTGLLMLVAMAVFATV